MAGVKVIFGGATINTGRAFESKEEIETLFAALKKYDVKAIDTAQLYGESETLLGSVNAGSQFIIDTKWKGGFAAGSPTKENIVKDADESMEKLKMDKVSNPPTPRDFSPAPGLGDRTSQLTIYVAPPCAGRHLLHPRARLERAAVRDTRGRERSVQEGPIHAVWAVQLPSGGRGGGVRALPRAQLRLAERLPGQLLGGRAQARHAAVPDAAQAEDRLLRLQPAGGRVPDQEQAADCRRGRPLRRRARRHVQGHVRQAGVPRGAGRVGGDCAGRWLLKSRSRVPVGDVQLAAEARVRRWDYCRREHSEAVGADDGGAEGWPPVGRGGQEDRPCVEDG
jgi:hypothetical protein